MLARHGLTSSPGRLLEIIGSGQHRQRRRALRHCGRSPPAATALRAAELSSAQITEHQETLTPAGLRSVREALPALERTVWLRIEMRSAFSGEPITVQRLEIPPW